MYSVHQTGSKVYSWYNLRSGNMKYVANPHKYTDPTNTKYTNVQHKYTNKRTLILLISLLMTDCGNKPHSSKSVDFNFLRDWNVFSIPAHSQFQLFQKFVFVKLQFIRFHYPKDRHAT